MLKGHRAPPFLFIILDFWLQVVLLRTFNSSNRNEIMSASRSSSYI